MCEKKRCRWAAGSEEMIRYHDQEWGTPQHDDAKLFELFLLEGFQAGLSWAIVLKKQEAFRRALDGFDAEKIAAYGEEKIQSLLQDESIIRSERKLRAAVTNAQTYLRIRQEFGSFGEYLWRFVNHKPLRGESFPPPASTPLAERLSKDLRKRGMKFAGPVIVYSFMQASGMTNDHEPDCFRA